MVQRLIAVSTVVILAAACGASTTEGGSRTDFFQCESSAECLEGACVDGLCDPDVEPSHKAAALTGRACSQDQDCDGLVCDFMADECVPDCRDADRSCHAPQVCSLAPGGSSYRCRYPDAEPACSGSPTGQAVPFTTTKEDGTGATLHWVKQDTCIPISYTASLADTAALIERAAQAWSDVGCSRVCLGKPEQREDPPDVLRGERRIHFTTSALDDFEGAGMPEIHFQRDTGSMISVIVRIDSDATVRAQLGLDGYLDIVGHALGLAHAETTDSVMGQRGVSAGPDRFSGPTALDAEALCRLYGDDPYCE